jgi:NADPH2:quinone reductase
MRRVRYYERGGPEVLQIEEVDIPDPAPGQVQIATEAIGTSFVDTSFRRGTSAFGQPELPGSPHGDVVGTVTALGQGVDSVRIGDRVTALVNPDAYADYTVADAAWLAPVPAGVDHAVASVLEMPAPVALLALRTGRVSTGDTVLVHSAAGSIGHLALQLARLEGAVKIIATVGSPAKFDFVTEYGADVAISYGDADWTEQVQAVAPRGVDVIVDSVGGSISAQSLELLAPFGRLVIYGAAAGELPQVPAKGLYSLRSVSGFSWLAWLAAAPEQARRDLTEIAAHAAAGRLRVAVQETLPLDEVVKAHTLLEDRARTGRILLTP